MFLRFKNNFFHVKVTDFPFFRFCLVLLWNSSLLIYFTDDIQLKEIFFLVSMIFFIFYSIKKNLSSNGMKTVMTSWHQRFNCCGLDSYENNYYKRSENLRQRVFIWDQSQLCSSIRSWDISKIRWILGLNMEKMTILS